jgi:hypothetical protein
MQFVASRASDPIAGGGGRTGDNFRRAVRSFTDSRSRSDGPSGHSTAPSSRLEVGLSFKTPSVGPRPHSPRAGRFR